jgi:putative ABC transport system ATP-binding protein
MDLLFQLAAERGTTLLLVTHEADLARRAQRIVELADGAIVSDSVPSLAAAAAR